MNDIELVYVKQDTPGTDPGILAVFGQIALAILTGVAKGLSEAAVSAGKQLLSMFTVERLTAALTNYAREQAGAWVTKTVIDAGNQQWLGSMLHAFGLDMEDLLNVAKNSLDRGFEVLTANILNGFTKSGVGTGSIPVIIADALGIHHSQLRETLVDTNAATNEVLKEHSAVIAGAYGQWSLYQAQNYSAEEEKTRMHLSAIFTDTEERIRSRSKLSAEENITTTSDITNKNITEKVPGAIRVAAEKLRPIQDFLNEVALSVRNSIYTMLVPSIPVSYEHVGVTAISAFGTAMGLGFGAHLAATAADLLHPLKITGLPQVAAFLADMAGFGAIARATWYTDLTNFLATPYRHYSLRYFRPTLPRESEIMRLYAENCIREEDFTRAMQYWGYSDAWITAYKRNVYRDPRHFELSMIAEDATVDTAWIYRQLRDAGYSPDDSGPLAEAILKKSLRPYFSDYRNALEDLFASGYITEEQFDTQLQPLQLRSEAHLLTKKTARFKFIKEYTDESIRLFNDMFEKDLIDEDDFRTALAGLGVVPERRNIIVNRALVKKRARIAREEKAEIKKQIRQRQEIMEDIYITAYRAGRLSEDELLAALRFAGIDNELATLTVELEKEKRRLVETRKAMYTVETERERIKKKYEAGYISLFRKDLIDSETLAKFLKELGLEDDYINAIVETEIYRKTKPEPVTIQ